MTERDIILSELFSSQSATRKILDEMVGGGYNLEVLPPDEHGIICVAVVVDAGGR